LKSLALVKAMGLPYMEGLPVVEGRSEVKPRSKNEVVERCLATAICAVKGETKDQKLVDGLVARWEPGRSSPPRGATATSMLRSPRARIT
jgi:hypothetical protein